MKLLVIIIPFFLCSCYIRAASSDWLSFALQTQRDLSIDIGIDTAIFIGTHNSFNTDADGYNYTNQHLSITEQLNLGVRWFELDLHYIPELVDTTSGAYRICHSSGGLKQLCDAAGWDKCSAYGLVDYGNDTGCTEHARNYTEVLGEIANWMSSHTSEVILINLDSQLSDADFSSADINSTLTEWLATIFGDTLITASFLADHPHGYPSILQLQQTTHRILFNSNNHRFDGNLIIPDFRGLVWPASKINQFAGYPVCVSQSNITLQFLFFQEDKLIVTVPDYGTISNGTASVGVFTEQSAHDVLRCGISQLFDFVSADLLTVMSVWSWEVEQPATVNDQLCGVLNHTSGRWYAESCNNLHSFACRDENDPTIWLIEHATSSRDCPHSASCPPGYVFATPMTSVQNQELITVSQEAGDVWISLNNYHGSGWTANAEEADGAHGAVCSGSTIVLLSNFVIFMFGLYHSAAILRVV